MITKLEKALLLMSKNNKKTKNELWKKFNKNNMFFIGFFIFISIPIIIGFIFGAGRLWYDVISIVSIFYIGLPILMLIFTMNEKGWIRKTIGLFKFKEMKDMKNNHLSPEEEKKIKAFKLKEEEAKNPKLQVDSVFISIALIIYGLLLLLITTPSLILFLIK